MLLHINEHEEHFLKTVQGVYVLDHARADS